MSAYFGKMNYTGIANWMRIQAEEERTQMLKLIDIVVDRDGTVDLLTIPTQSNNFGNPLGAF